ncbi:MAG: hypothetical protein VR73_13795 [Gammaproteobacteria bacterium BRH_c0]|nr:MAG: hypothetical protein VR73_13795 [Gammaproteobacteria bacterium BRH_c0]
MNEIQKNRFLCPECGSADDSCLLESCISISDAPDFSDPWAGVQRTITCSQCGCVIPAYLAERWDDITEQVAKERWQDFKSKTEYKDKEWFEYKGRMGRGLKGAMVPKFNWNQFIRIPGAEAFVRHTYFSELKRLIREIDESRNGTNIAHLDSVESVITRLTPVKQKQVEEWLNSRDWSKATFSGVDFNKSISVAKTLILKLFKGELYVISDARYQNKLSDIIADLADSRDPIAEYLYALLTRPKAPNDPLLAEL